METLADGCCGIDLGGGCKETHRKGKAQEFVCGERGDSTAQLNSDVCNLEWSGIF